MRHRSYGRRGWDGNHRSPRGCVAGRRRRRFMLALWIAFVARGSLHALVAPMWAGFDEPFHLAYVTFVAEHLRPPGFSEPALPFYYLSARPLLPSGVPNFFGIRVPNFVEWRTMPPAERAARRTQVATVTCPTPSERHRYAFKDYERQQPPLFYYLAAPVARLFRDATLPTLL